MKNPFIGTGVALITPFEASGAVDFSALGRLMSHIMEGAVNYWVVMGTTGESATLSKEEKQAVLAFVQEHNTKRLPVVYGVGGNNTAAVVAELNSLDYRGIDGILTVCPYYNRPSQRGIIAHYKAVADAAKKPIIMYNIPGRTGVNMTVETTVELSKHPNIVGVKEASGDVVQVVDIKRQVSPDFLITVGDDLLAVPMIAVGAEGSICVLGNLYPKEFTSMIDAALKGDFKTANTHLAKFADLNPHLYAEGNPVGAKVVLETLDICTANVRLPLAEASDELKATIKGKMF